MDANLTELLYAKETQFGVIPATPPKLTKLRFVSSTLAHRKNTAQSEEVRADRARAGLIELGKAVSGELATELLVGGYDDLLLAALLASDWASGTELVTASATAATGTISISSGTLSALAQGAHWVKLSGFANSGNNGIKRVVSASGTALVVEGLEADEASANITVAYRYARNGLELVSLLFEAQYLGLQTPVYAAFPGVCVNEWRLDLQSQARAAQTFALMGTRAELGTATFGDGAPNAASTRKVCNTAGNIGGLYWAGAQFAVPVLSATIALNNNLRERLALGRQYTLEFGKGTVDVNVTMQAYFENRTMLDVFMQHQSGMFQLPVFDPDGNMLGVTLPKVEATSGYPEIGGVNTDLMLPLEFSASVGSQGYVIQVDRLDA